MIIRKAKNYDIPVIHRLAHEIWWPTYHDILSANQISFMLNDMYSEHALENQINEGVEFLVIETEGKPAGFAGFSLVDPENMAFKIHKIYLLPSQQGKGSGRKLLEYISAQASARGAKSIELNVNRHNPAFNFYKKLGFSVAKEVDIPYHNWVLNDYVMKKDL